MKHIIATLIAVTFVITLVADEALGQRRKRREPPPGELVPHCVSIELDPGELAAGTPITATCFAMQPTGDRFTLRWSTTGGTIVGKGGSVTIDTTDLEPGVYTVTVEVLQEGFPPVPCPKADFRVLEPRD